MADTTPILEAWHLSEYPGGFGLIGRDITRPGGNPTFKIDGSRGERVTLMATTFAIDRETAEALKAAWETQQGTEVWLVEKPSASYWKVFVHRVSARLDTIGLVTSEAALEGCTLRLQARLEVERTA